MSKYNKILGSIMGAAVGDAMGAATETRSAERIKEDFGGYVDKIITPPSDCFARGYDAGTVTDDFSLAYFTAKELVASRGIVDAEVAKKALFTWASYPQFFRFAGPTTEAAIKKLKGEETVNQRPMIAADNLRATNGSGMKIFPVGLINPGNLDKAVQDTITICMPTHNNNVAISGAAAISAAVAKAMEDNATLNEVIEAGIYGAHKGFEDSSRIAHRLATPSVEKRISLAVEIGKKGADWESAMLELRNIIGAGLMATEAHPMCIRYSCSYPWRPYVRYKNGR